MEEKALQPGNTVPAAPDKRPDFSLADFKEGRVFEWLTGLKSGYQQAMEEQALADLAKELGFKGFARCLREYRKELRAVSLSVVRDDGISEFFDQALELNVGEWTADESGIWRYAQGGGITYACTHPIMPVEKLVSIDTGMVKVKLWYRRSYSDRRPWSEIVVPMAGTLIENLPLVIDAGMQLISGLADGIIGAIPVLIGQLPELIDQILGFLTESLPTILEQGSTILLSLTDGIIGAIPTLVEMLPEVVTSICGFVTENLPTILEQGVQILTSLATGIIGALPELIGQIPAIITGIVGTLSENFPSIVSTGVTLLLELGAGIISAIPQLVAQLPAIGAAILGAFGEIPGMVLGVGKSIVEGLWSGISSMASWVADKVKGFAGDIVNGIKGFLGIHSPSTVFAEIGDNMALGLGKGFGDSMKDVTEDIKGAVPTNLDGPEIDVPEPNGPADVTYGVYPNVEGIDEIGNAIADSVYKVSPIIEDVNTPSVSDVTYSVNPLVEDFNPPSYEQYASDEDGEGGYPEQVDGGGNGGIPEPDGGSTGNGGGGFTFSPTVTVQITVEGNADSEALEEMRAQLMAEFETKMRELYDEFREEELQQAALKNQYAF